MLKPTKLSIVIPSFNQGQFLDQTLNSIFSQDYKNFEVIVIDGGSTDNSVAIINKFAKKYPQLAYWHSKKDNGQVDALTQGFAKATGEIFAFINSDDYYLPGTFSKVIQHFKDNSNCRWLIGDSQVTKASLRWTFAIKHAIPLSQFPWLLYVFNWVNQPATFWRRSLFKEAGSLDPTLHYAFDYDLWLRFAKITPPCRLRLPFSAFRVHQAAKGSSGFQKQFTEDYAVATRYTKNSLVRGLHRLLMWFTISSYKLLK